MLGGIPAGSTLELAAAPSEVPTVLDPAVLGTGYSVIASFGGVWTRHSGRAAALRATKIV